MSNALTNVVSGDARRIWYIVLGVIGTTLAGTAAGFAATDNPIPEWLLFASAFYTAVAGPGYALPASNIHR